MLQEQRHSIEIRKGHAVPPGGFQQTLPEVSALRDGEVDEYTLE
jgi:hypothetical protein